MEQYEHMKGPHSAVGLKFLLHRQGAVPLMEDFGKNIPVGAHTFVGVSITNVSNISFSLPLTVSLSISLIVGKQLCLMFE